MENNFDKLINKDTYQVFVMYSRAHMPFSFAIHPWIICNEKGKISRWEVLYKPNENKQLGYLHENYYLPFSGIEIFNFSNRRRWQGKLLKEIEGEAAKAIIEFINVNKGNYPCKNYFLMGENSNTFVKWVLSNFPEIDARLPWNAFGKNIDKKKFIID